MTIIAKEKIGAIATLIRYEKNMSKYDYSIIRRNNAISEHLYWSEPGKSIIHMIIFHEGNLPVSYKKYIPAGSMQLPLIFIDVSKVFQSYQDVNRTQCPSLLIVKQMFPPGYHSMCYFWFLKFIDYLPNYDWMLRIDEDCIINKESRHFVHDLPSEVHVASTLWLNMAKGTSDIIHPHHEGTTVRGLYNLTQTYAKIHQIFDKDVESWYAPYTNVLYINLNWLRNSSLVLGYMQEVEHSQCIYSNRWGDLPLCGAVYHLTKEPRYHLRLHYYHGSHKTHVNGTTKGLGNII